jgi:hypothetical protein
MYLTTAARRLGGLAAGILLVTTLSVAGPPAHAAPVFTQAQIGAYAGADNTSSTSCSVADNPSPAQLNVPVAENGPPVTLSTSNTGTVTNDGDPGDVISFTTSSTSTGRVTSVGGDPGSVALTTTGHVEAATSRSVSACAAVAFAAAILDLTFTVTRSGFMTFVVEADRGSYAQVYLTNVDDTSFYDQTGFGVHVSGTARVHLTPGTYIARLQANPYLLSTSTAVPRTPASVSVRGTFAVAGSQIETAKGKGRRYLSAASARSCSTHSVDLTVTRKRTRAEQVRAIRFFVNGTKLRTVRNPHRGRLVRLPVADEAGARVRAEVVLRPSRPGRKPRVKEVTAGYAACSAR